MTQTQDSGGGAYAAIKDFVLTEAAYQQAKAAYTAARKGLLDLVPHEIGEHAITEGNFEVKVEYPEKIVWDKDSLDALYGQEKPVYVKAAYSIDLRDLKKLPQSERDQLERCYEVKPGTPKIDIVVNKGTP